MKAKLFLLGDFRFETTAGRNVSIGRTKSRALFALTALSKNGSISRRRAAELIWSEGLDPRASLRQAIRDIRATLKRAALPVFHADFQNLHIDLTQIWVDALDVAAAVHENDPGRLDWIAGVSLGPLISDIVIDDPAFDEWLATERALRADHLVQALEQVLAAARDPADHTKIRQFAGALLTLDRTNERAHRRLISTYLLLGDHGAALRQYQHCVDYLSNDLGVTPSPETLALAQKVKQRASVKSDRSPATAPSHEMGRPALSTSARPALFASDIKLHNPHTPVTVTIHPFVAPAEHTHSPLLAQVLRESIAANLSRFRWLSCKIDDDHPARTPASYTEGQYTVRGSLTPQCDQFLLISQLCGSNDGQIYWMVSSHLNPDDAEDNITAVANRLTQHFVREIQQREEILARHGSEDNLTSFQAILRAIPLMHDLTPVSLSKAGRLLTQIIDNDPTNASAHAWLAFQRSLLIGQGTANQREDLYDEIGYFTARALELEPANANSRAIAAHMEAFVHHDLTAAVDLFDEALKINPNSAHAMGLSAITQCYIGDASEGLRRLNLYRDMAPFDMRPYYFDTARCIANFLCGHFEEALQIGRRAMRLNPHFTATYRPVIASLGNLGRREEAKDVISTLHLLEPDFSIGWFRQKYPPLKAYYTELYIDSLRRAGVRE